MTKGTQLAINTAALIASIPAPKAGERPLTAGYAFANLAEPVQRVRNGQPVEGEVDTTASVLWFRVNYKRTGLTVEGNAEQLQNFFNGQNFVRGTAADGADLGMLATVRLTDVTPEQLEALIGERCRVTLRGEQNGTTEAADGTTIPTFEEVEVGFVSRNKNGTYVFHAYQEAAEDFAKVAVDQYGNVRGDVINIGKARARKVAANKVAASKEAAQTAPKSKAASRKTTKAAPKAPKGRKAASK